MSLLQKAYRAGTEWSFQLGILPSFVAKGLNHFILVYHSVSKENNTKFNARHEPLNCFEKQVWFLKTKFHIITLHDFFQKKFITGKINVAITFDDGYRNNYLYAKPILEKYGVPATIFISGLNDAGERILWADFVNIISYYHNNPVTINSEIFEKKNGEYISQQTAMSLYEVIKKVKPDYAFKQEVYHSFSSENNLFDNSSLSDYWQLMSDEEIKECSASSFIEIGSHGYYHNNLGNLTLSAASEELRRSKRYLENLIQQPVESIAYPDSSYTRNLLDVAEQIGYKYQLAADGFLFEEDKTDDRIRDRIGIYNCGRCGNQLLQTIKK